MTVTREALLALAGWADEFSRPGFATATWQGGKPGPDGVIQMPYATYSDRLDAFVADMSRVEMVRPFDWMRWVESPRAQELLNDPNAVAGASAEEVSGILTTVIRAERFGDGSIEGAFAKGIVQAAARRAHTLTEA